MQKDHSIGITSYLPSFLPSLWQRPSPLVEVLIDAERQILYTRSQSSAIGVRPLFSVASTRMYNVTHIVYCTLYIIYDGITSHYIIYRDVNGSYRASLRSSSPCCQGFNLLACDCVRLFMYLTNSLRPVRKFGTDIYIRLRHVNTSRRPRRYYYYCNVRLCIDSDMKSFDSKVKCLKILLNSVGTGLPET